MMLCCGSKQGAPRVKSLNEEPKDAGQALKEVFDIPEIAERIFCHLSPDNFVHFACTSRSNLKIWEGYEEYLDTTMNTLTSNPEISGVCFNICRFRFVPICNIKTKFTKALTVLKTQKAEDIMAWNPAMRSVSTVLKTQKADVNAKNIFEHTPLFEATSRGQTEIAQALIDVGADDVNAKNTIFIQGTQSNGHTLLHVAARNGNLALVDDLIAAGADVNAKNEDGETPLHWAASEIYRETVHVSEWCRKIVVAHSEGHKEIVEILRAAGADSHKSCVIS